MLLPGESVEIEPEIGRRRNGKKERKKRENERSEKQRCEEVINMWEMTRYYFIVLLSSDILFGAMKSPLATFASRILLNAR